MRSEVIFYSAILVGSGLWLLWVAHLIWNRGRIDLVRLGSKPLPGADLLKGKFALLPFLSGLLSFVVVALTMATNSITPWLFMYGAVLVLLAIWRGVLVRGLEVYASRAVKSAA